ncbi:calmodulin-domain kinase (macronuclear) [Tetrahymena thermophila SB210]|uniref:non-specific serine/threonine protein kinase n=1 Tax=Tetrahymena thermophila (strain SB210) TaxID=312017 RepID=Q235N7_TETTS|nr:calmodulin-domain kinase [Tetrahymena thermophila SB210]EAR92243.2 calmodulin-domain kinase [Tetrahymena thermophila SB210]|eukprot:XP_001012488.2 calmodulin-domain kinase [Tetrahymena thermophila SB210]
MGCGNSQVRDIERKQISDEKTAQTQANSQKGNKKNSPIPKEEQQILIQKEMYIKEINSKDIREDYFFERHLAQGEFGDIRIVKHKKTGQSRALKIVAKNKLGVKEKQVLNEIKILSKLDHPNIIKLYEYYQDRYAYYLIFELLLGGQLIEYIQETSYLPETQSASIVQQLLSAINYCHQQKITHLNITPQNILLNIDEETNQVSIKIINWFFSRSFEENDTFSEQINNITYKSPEEINKSYNYLADVWSIGVIWFLILMGVPPFYGINRKKTIEAIQNIQMRYSCGFSIKHDSQIQEIFKKIFVSQDQRMKCQDILDHQYFKDIFQEFDQNDEKYIQNLQKQKELRQKDLIQMMSYHSHSKFYQAVVNFIGFYLVGDDEMQKLTEDFQRIDVNKDGQLSREEIRSGFEGFFIEQITDIDQFLDELFQKIDCNKNGYINYNEFISVAMDKINLQQDTKLKQAFSYFDQDQNGFITKEELFQSLQSQFNDDKNIEKMWQTILEKGDKNKDGKLSYQEFIDMLKQLS